jgi:hypothetical protein
MLVNHPITHLQNPSLATAITRCSSQPVLHFRSIYHNYSKLRVFFQTYKVVFFGRWLTHVTLMDPLYLANAEPVKGCKYYEHPLCELLDGIHILLLHIYLMTFFAVLHVCKLLFCHY